MEVTPMPPSDGASLLASGITFDSVPDVADIAPCDLAADLARHADLTMQLAIWDRNVVDLESNSRY